MLGRPNKEGLEIDASPLGERKHRLRSLSSVGFSVISMFCRCCKASSSSHPCCCPGWHAALLPRIRLHVPEIRLTIGLHVNENFYLPFSWIPDQATHPGCSTVSTLTNRACKGRAFALCYMERLMRSPLSRLARRSTRHGDTSPLKSLAPAAAPLRCSPPILYAW